MLRRIAAPAVGGAALAGVAYGVAALAAVLRFARASAPAGEPLPATILVPLHGTEPGLEARLRAFVEQDVDDHQVIFGVADARDGAFAVAERVAAAYPARSVDVAVGRRAGARNPKVATLLAMLPLARRPAIVIVDSDMRVDPSYLRAVTAPLRDAGVGAVTCLYAGVPASDLASRLGAMFITEQFAPSALVDRAIAPLRHCFGATMAVRRSVLDAVGGLDALAPHLADDHLLGRLISERGWRVVLSRYVVRNAVSESGLAGLWHHEVRWHRTIRALQPRGYALMFLTYPAPLAALALGLAPRRATVALFALAVLTRYALGRAASRALGVPAASPWLRPLRDAFGLAVWVAGAAGSSVRWRDARLTVDGDGVLIEEGWKERDGGAEE